MAMCPLRTVLLKLSFDSFSSIGGRSYHPEMCRIPDVPLLIHDSDYQLFPESSFYSIKVLHTFAALPINLWVLRTFPEHLFQIKVLQFLMKESGRPFSLFVPDLSELNYDDFKSEAILRFNDSLLQGQRLLKWTSEINVILNSNQAIQTAREIPSRLMKSNYFISQEGTIAVERMLQLEKLMTSTKDKLAEISSKIPDTRDITPRLIKIWENIKIRLPSWQKSIANKLQAFQNRLNKKIPPTKKEEEC